MFCQQRFQGRRPPAHALPATLSRGWQRGYLRLITKPSRRRASNHPCISQSANSKKHPTAEIKVIESIKNREIVQKQNPCLLPKSTILKLIQIKNVSGDKAAPVVWKPLSCIKNGGILGPVGLLLSIGLKQRSQHAEAALNPCVFCTSAHNS